ncbi:3-oxoacyl-[acyl-carrier-protein] synthase III C-terminal domain-containing protein [Aegicerativicinus sediminis]|uniref:3-oxoacyl-[acyl-carrier-protein] synthase III C-terminal domain-containing protein n=1 Tax=Aegicerativicinus sediminis TaxID=2893202 RepID=UPI001E3CFFCE|nr:3-oxoacyl-[acyl-carrier-protein] synthase III C-terminal domain-containing protein [Aegicerativicinus sediminis]
MHHNVLRKNTVIESLGSYLPPNFLSTKEVLEGCNASIRFPLEKITGIKSRHVAGKEEFSIDLSIQAINDCLEKSKYKASDIDLVVCCNISRIDSEKHLTFEPSTSVRLKRHFGFNNAIAFDISNACAGMFTGIYLVDALIKAGSIKRAMVVSGEYITHLTRTAQKEIKTFMDPKMACLTLGDAGAAVILEESSDPKVGFHQLSLQTLGRYSPFCIAKQAETEGWIMITDSVNLTDAGIKSSTQFAISSLDKAGWNAKDCDHLIMHQTSKTTIKSAVNEINSILNSNLFHEGNTVNNLEQCGNTASTSHMIALADQIKRGVISKGDKIAFSIAASGLTIGSGLYVMDGLAENNFNGKTRTKAFIEPDLNHPIETIPYGVIIESVGIAEPSTNQIDSLELLHSAALKCLEQSSYQANDIDLLIYCGVYRSEYIVEPAIAALLAGMLDMNSSILGEQSDSTLAFDVFNGSVGMMNALYLVQNLFLAGKHKSAMVVTAEVENNAVHFPNDLLGVHETATAIILAYKPNTSKGFSRFNFCYNTDAITNYTTQATPKPINHYLKIHKTEHLEELYLNLISDSVEELLSTTNIKKEDIRTVFPPQLSASFISRLSKNLGINGDKFVDVAIDGEDLFTSSIPYCLNNSESKEGTIALLITVGSGLQAGCALYYF